MEKKKRMWCNERGQFSLFKVNVGVPVVTMGMQEATVCLLLDGPVWPDVEFGPVTKRIQNMVIVFGGQSRKYVVEIHSHQVPAS